MPRPRFTNVQFHKAYVTKTDSETRFFCASMTALDTEGRVWRTWQDTAGNWAPWNAMTKYVDPYAIPAGAG